MKKELLFIGLVLLLGAIFIFYFSGMTGEIVTSQNKLKEKSQTPRGPSSYFPNPYPLPDCPPYPSTEPPYPDYCVSGNVNLTYSYSTYAFLCKYASSGNQVTISPDSPLNPKCNPDNETQIIIYNCTDNAPTQSVYSCPSGQICVPADADRHFAVCGNTSSYAMCYYQYGEVVMEEDCKDFLNQVTRNRQFLNFIPSIKSIISINFPAIPTTPPAQNYLLKITAHGGRELIDNFLEDFFVKPPMKFETFNKEIIKDSPATEKIIYFRLDSCEMGFYPQKMIDKFQILQNTLKKYKEDNDFSDYKITFRVPQSICAPGCKIIYLPSSPKPKDLLNPVRALLRLFCIPGFCYPEPSAFVITRPFESFDDLVGVPFWITLDSKEQQVQVKYESCDNVLESATLPDYACSTFDMLTTKKCSRGNSLVNIVCCKKYDHSQTSYNGVYYEGKVCPTSSLPIDGDMCVDKSGEIKSYDGVREYFCNFQNIWQEYFPPAISAPEEILPECFPYFYWNNLLCPKNFAIDLGNGYYGEYAATSLEEDIPPFIDYYNNLIETYGMPETLEEFENMNELINNYYVQNVRNFYEYKGQKRFPNKIWAYQENANYIEEGGWDTFANAFDGNWLSSTPLIAETGRHLNLSYERPENAVEAVWQIKPGDGSDDIKNISIPELCFYSDSIKLFINGSESGISYFCSENEGINYTLLFQSPGTSFYEEGIWWGLINDSRLEYEENSEFYSQSPSNLKFSNLTKIFDGDWNTSETLGPPNGGNYHSLSINYEIPPDTISSIWQIKDRRGMRNITIPSACLNESELKLTIGNFYSSNFNTTLSCGNNPASRYVLDSYVSSYYRQIKIYEEAMIWNVSYGCIPNCNGKMCGDDGCGRSCGTCLAGKTCANGACISPRRLSINRCKYEGQWSCPSSRKIKICENVNGNLAPQTHNCLKGEYCRYPKSQCRY